MSIFIFRLSSTSSIFEKKNLLTATYIAWGCQTNQQECLSDFHSLSDCYRPYFYIWFIVHMVYLVPNVF